MHVQNVLHDVLVRPLREGAHIDVRTPAHGHVATVHAVGVCHHGRQSRAVGKHRGHHRCNGRVAGTIDVTGVDDTEHTLLATQGVSYDALLEYLNRTYQ